MKIRVSISLVGYGVHHVLFEQGQYTGMVGDPVTGMISKIELANEITATPSEQTIRDLDRLNLIEIHTAAFRPHLDGNIKRVELNLEGTKPTTIHHRSTKLRHLEMLDTMAGSEPRDEMGRVVVSIDGFRFQREEIRSIINNASKRFWFAIAGNGEGGEAGEKASELSKRQLDLIELYVRIGEGTEHKVKEVTLMRDTLATASGTLFTFTGQRLWRVSEATLRALEDEHGGSYNFNSETGDKEILIAGKAKFIKRYSSTSTTPEWLASFDESDRSVIIKAPAKEEIDLVALHKIIAQMHPKRREAQLVASPPNTVIYKHDHRVIPEVIEALEAEVERGQYVVSDHGEVTIWVGGKEYRKVRLDNDSGHGWFAWLDL